MKWLACALVVVGAASGAAGEGEVPKYKLERGQRLTYVGTSQFESPARTYEGKEKAKDGSWVSVQRATRARTDTAEYRIEYIPVSRNADGSLRVLVMRSVKTVDGGQPHGPFESMSRIEVRDDGVIEESPRAQVGHQGIADVFPRLPGNDAELTGGWRQTTGDGWATSVQRVLDRKPGRISIERTIEGPWAEALHAKMSERIEFDEERGVVQSIERSVAREVGTPTSQRISLSLASVERVGEEELDVLKKESDRLVELKEMYRDLTLEMSGGTDPEGTAERLKKALSTVDVDFQTPMMRREAENLVDFGSRVVESHYREFGRRRLQQIGQAAPAWELPDLEGKPHALGESRGKVVLLNFWEGTPDTTIRLLLQAKEIEERFRGKPVVVLSLCLSDDVVTARTVAEGLRLPFMTLLGAAPMRSQIIGIGFPEYVVIDADGRILDFGAGADEGREERLMETIEKALKEAAE